MGTSVSPCLEALFEACECQPIMVRRCRLTASEPVLKALLVSALETRIA